MCFYHSIASIAFVTLTRMCHLCKTCLHLLENLSRKILVLCPSPWISENAVMDRIISCSNTTAFSELGLPRAKCLSITVQDLQRLPGNTPVMVPGACFSYSLSITILRHQSRFLPGNWFYLVIKQHSGNQWLWEDVAIWEDVSKLVLGRFISRTCLFGLALLCT